MKPTLLRRPLDVDPLALAATLADRPGTLLFHSQSAWGGAGASALLFDPAWTLRQELGCRASWSGRVPAPSPPPCALERLPLRLMPTPVHRTDGPAFVGLAGCFSYDLGPLRFGVLPKAPPPFDLPAAEISAYERGVLFSPGGKAELVVADLGDAVAGPRTPLEEAWEDARDRIAGLVDSSRSQPGPARSAGPLRSATPVHSLSNPTSAAELPSATAPRVGEIELFDPAWHHRAVRTIQAHLRAGDVYQVNLTGFATSRCGVNPFDAFLDQWRRNPVAFAAYLRTERGAITSHSPERLLRLSGGHAETAPIKGTLAAGPDDVRRLALSVKDRAEHVMIVDLCRNDLGVHAEYGSVRVRSLMETLRLSGLVHMVSRIEAEAGGDSRSELLYDLFPGGSITGAPKRRAMEIIATVEATGRGPYTGTLGFADVTGHSDWNIAIRTAVWQEGRVSFGCGGGIVLDSEPEDEYAEARLKARSFFDTLRLLGQDDQRQEATGS